MRFRPLQLRILVLALLVLVPAVAVAQRMPAAGTATVATVLSGGSEVARADGVFSPLGDGETVAPGDRLRTTGGGHALVTFFDGSTIELEPGAVVRIEEVGASDGAIMLRLFQTAGRTWSSIQKFSDPRSRYEIRTPTAIASVRGTGLEIFVAEDGTTDASVTDGAAVVAARGEEVVIRAGERTIVGPGAAPAPATTKPRPTQILRFGLHSPAFLAVVDPAGRTCGIVPGPTVVRQIVGCLATAPGVEPQVVDVRDPAEGIYTLVVSANGEGGPFRLTVSATESDALAFNFAQQGVIHAGELMESTTSIQLQSGSGVGSTGLTVPVVVGRSRIKAVLPSASPHERSASASPATPPPDLFRPLPTIGFEVGPTITPAATTKTSSPGPTATRAATPSPKASDTATPAPTARATDERTASATPTASPTPIAGPTQSAGPTPSPTPFSTPSPTPGAAVTSTPSPAPTASPTATSGTSAPPTASPAPTASSGGPSSTATPGASTAPTSSPRRSGG